ncbi:hypothetical protein [Pradoshia sp.]
MRKIRKVGRFLKDVVIDIIVEAVWNIIMFIPRMIIRFISHL